MPSHLGHPSINTSLPPLIPRLVLNHSPSTLAIKQNIRQSTIVQTNGSFVCCLTAVKKMGPQSRKVVGNLNDDKDDDHYHINGGFPSKAIDLLSKIPKFGIRENDAIEEGIVFGGYTSGLKATKIFNQFVLSSTSRGLVSQGLLLDSKQPFYWGSNFHVKMGVPQPMEENATYSSKSAGDQHLCGLRIPTNESHSLIDCWGYNMTASHEFGGRILSITASSIFNCGLFEHNLSALCFGDETGSNVISLIPRGLNFQSISACGFHVCRVLENFQGFCWGKSVGISIDDVELVPMDLIISDVGGRFHACGISSIDQGVNCWGLSLPNSVPPPNDLKVYEMAVGDYFTCGVVASKSLTPHCWGADGPWSVLPLVFFPGVCTPKECGAGFYEFKHESLGSRFCKPGNSMVCMPCTNDYLEGTYQVTSCDATSDRRCLFNYSACGSPECLSFCFSGSKSKTWRVFALQLPIFIGEVNSEGVGNDMIFLKIIKIK